MATVKHLMASPLGLSLAAADLPAFIIGLAWRWRRPDAGMIWRWLWRRGRPMLLTTLIAQAVLLLGTQAERLLTGGPEGALLVIYLVAHGWALAYVASSRRLADVFQDFPDPDGDAADAAKKPAPSARAKRPPVTDAPDASPSPMPSPRSGEDRTDALPLAPTLDQRLAIAARFMKTDTPEQIAARQRQLAEPGPETAAIWHALGIRAVRQEALAEAALLIETALERDADHGRYWRNLCEIRRRLGRLDAAIAAGQAAVQRQSSPAAHYNLALALAEAGQVQAAFHHYRIVLQYNPVHGRAWNNLGVIYRQQGDLTAARQAFRQALAVAPGLAQAQRNLQELS